MRKNFFLVKLVLLFILFAWILKSVNLGESLKVISKTNLCYFFGALILNNLSNLFLTVKWYRLASPLNIKSNFVDLLRLNYIAIFYSMFIPGQASGELIKGLKLSKKEGSHQNVWVPIFIDKITNLLITLIIGFIAILSDNTLSRNFTLIAIVSVLTIVFLTVTIILFSENTNLLLSFIKDGLVKILQILKIESKSIKDFALTYFESYKVNNRIMFETILWSFAIKIPHIFAFYLLALSLSININLVESAWLFSMVFLASILPISFSGLGVREGTILVLLSQIGIPNSSSLSLSMLIFINGIITALIGGLLELFSGLKVKDNSQ